MSASQHELGERLRREREKAGLSLVQLAALTGLSKTYLLRIETQPSNPSLQVLGQIADALDITVADLLAGPRVRIDPNELQIPSALRAFAHEEKLTSSEVRTLASIRFRKGEEPRTPERWRYILQSLRLSRSLDSYPESEHGDQD